MSLILPVHDGILTRRPDEFELDTDSSLAQGLRFAGLGQFTRSTRYQDSSLYGNNGTLSATMNPATDWVFDAELGRTYTTHDSTSKNVSVGNVLPLVGTDITCSAWVYVLDNGGYGNIIGKGSDAWRFGYYSYDAIGERFTFYSGSSLQYASIGSTLQGVWSHAAMTFKASTRVVKYYRDGDYKDTDTSGADVGANATNVTIGPAFTHTGKCRLSDVCLWDRALSLPEIRTLANPSDPMLGGLIQPITPRWLPVAVAGATPTTQSPFIIMVC